MSLFLNARAWHHDRHSTLMVRSTSHPPSRVLNSQVRAPCESQGQMMPSLS